MKRTIIAVAAVALILAGLLCAPKVATPTDLPEAEIEAIEKASFDPLEAPENGVWTREHLDMVIDHFALQYGVSASRMKVTISCESGYDTFIQSKHYHRGVREESYGISQINVFWNKDVTIEEARDPVFALEWMAKRWSEGYAHHWTCYRDNFGG